MNAAFSSGIHTVAWSQVSPGVCIMWKVSPPNSNLYSESNSMVVGISAAKLPFDFTSLGGARNWASLRY